MFDFLKKKTHDKSAKSPEPKDDTKTSPKKQLGGKDFGAQEEALKPKDEAPKDEKSGGKKGFSLKDGMQNMAANIQRWQYPESWCKEKWAQAEQVAAKLSFEQALVGHYTAFRQVCEAEFSTENLDCYRALEYGTMSKQDTYDTFVAAGTQRQVNLPNADKAHALAQQGKYDQIDWDAIQHEVHANLVDTWSRVIYSEPLIRSVFKNLNGQEAPKKYKGGY